MQNAERRMQNGECGLKSRKERRRRRRRKETGRRTGNNKDDLGGEKRGLQRIGEVKGGCVVAEAGV